MPEIIWKLILSGILIFNGIAIIIRKKKSGISLSEQYDKEKWYILILIILILVLIPLMILF